MSDDEDFPSSDDDFGSSGGEDLSASASSLAGSGAGWGDEDDFSDLAVSQGKQTDQDYELLTAAQVMERPLEMISEVNDLFQIEPAVARQLLQHSSWNSEKLVTRYFAGEKDKLFEEAKIPPHLGETHERPKGEIDCSVCFDSFQADGDEIFGMSCDHYFCRECYQDYLAVKINSEGNAANIPCPAQDCFLEVDEVTALKLLDPGATRDRYLKLVAKAFVRDNKALRGCPAPGCGNFARMALVSKVCVVKCPCGEEYCSGCQQTSHRPCACEMIKRWNDKMQSDSESENWLKLYTKACPKCGTMVSKDGGCQYIRCRNCNTGWCWLCLGFFDHKAHNCNTLELAPDASEAAKSLAKWEHFSKRYASHAQAITLQAKLMSKSKDCISKLENQHHKAYIELVFIEEATATILAARKVLKDTYVYGYFLPESVNRVLFEHLQGQLEHQTETLSGLIEKPAEAVYEKRLQIIDIDKALRGSLANVLEALESGDVRGGAGSKPADDAEWAKDVKAPEYSGWIYNA